MLGAGGEKLFEEANFPVRYVDIDGSHVPLRDDEEAAIWSLLVTTTDGRDDWQVNVQGALCQCTEQFTMIVHH